MTDTWRTLSEGAAAGLSGTETREQASDAPSDGGELRNDYRAAEQIDVAEGRRLLAAAKWDRKGVEMDAMRGHIYDTDADLMLWLIDNLPKLLDAASDRDAANEALEMVTQGWEPLPFREIKRLRAAVARVEAVIAAMHEDWCRAKHDPDRECECIHAEIRAAIDGSET